MQYIFFNPNVKMDVFPLLSLPTDLIKLLINEVFDPITSLRCLRVCKRLNDLGDRTKIIYRVLMFNTELEFQKQFSQLILSPKCFIKMKDHESLKKHLQKHIQMEKKNRLFPCHNPFKRSSCRYCKGPTSNFTNHTCLLQSKSCLNVSVGYIYPWAEPLCHQDAWYKIDPNFLGHKCYARCKVCKKVFESGYLENDKCGFNVHFNECQMRNKMIEIYHLRGDRTDEEWNEFKKSIKDQPNELESSFEKEYLEWKNIREREENKEKKFVQKKYSIIHLN